MGLSSLLQLPASTLESLATAFKGGQLRYGLDRGVIEGIAGRSNAHIYPALSRLTAGGATTATLGEICATLAEARRSTDSARDGVEIVLSGPEVPGVRVTDTATIAQSLISQAKNDVIICSYVFRLHKDFFSALAARHDAEPDLRVRVIVDLFILKDSPSDAAPTVANRFRNQFLSNCWQGIRAPEFFYEPRAFEDDATKRGVMHAKGVIVDDTAALITSANFTDAAQSRNIEVGVLMRDRHQVMKLRTYFEGLISRGKLLVIS